MTALIARRTDALNRHDAVTLSSLYAADCQVESPLAAGTVQGRQALAKVNQALFDAFPDVRFEPDMVLVDGPTVVASGRLTGTYTGGFMELPPNGNVVTVPVVTISTARDGEIVFERRVYDFTGMLIQAGVLRARSA